jgi:hypothetical protein
VRRRAEQRRDRPGPALAVLLTAASNVGAVQFSKELRDDVAAGDITVSFRLWQRPQVKVRGRYGIGRGDVEIEIDSIEPVRFRDISAADVRRAGERDREALRQRAAHAAPIHDDTLLYRIAFHVVG